MQTDDPGEVEGYVVEHDRRDDLTDLVFGFEHTNHPTPNRPDNDSGEDGEHPVQDCYLGPEQCNSLGKRQTHDILALSSDIEEAYSFCEAHGKTTEDKGHREVQRLGDVPHVHSPIVDIVA